MAAKKPILFGLAGEPLCRADGTEIEAETAEEALNAARTIKQTRYLRVLAHEDHFVVLLDTNLAQQSLFCTMTRENVDDAVRAGANVNARNKRGTVPLDSILAGGTFFLPALEGMLSYGVDMHSPMNTVVPDWMPLHTAVAHCNVQAVDLLIAHGADVNMRTTEGRTPLHWAALFGHARVVALLLKRGADVQARDDLGATPLCKAIQLGKQQIVDMLTAHTTN